jgi:mono/diheme cytochrome c family protein
MRRIFHIFVLLPWLLVAQGPPTPRANVRDFLGLGPPPDAAAAKFGESLYKDNCSTCHGQNARGSQAPSLVRSPLVLHDEKGEAITPVVRKGRIQAGMPAFADLSDTQIYNIAEYIHLQIELAANRGTYKQSYDALRNQVTGDGVQGKEVFQTRCAGCHASDGDLAHIGSKYPQPPVMLGRIAWPTSANPKQATVTEAGGRQVTGVLLKLDDFDVELRDTNGDYHDWPRSKVKVAVQDKLAGHRNLLAQYSDADLHNLTAYLVSLK